MTTPFAAEIIHSHGCRIVLRRVDGPEARELFFLCQPEVGESGAGTDARSQVEAVYQAILDVLEAEGSSFAGVVCETVFVRDMSADLESIRGGRYRALTAHGALGHRPALTEIEQPPLNAGAALEVSMQAVLSKRDPIRMERVEAPSACDCAECMGAMGLAVQIGEMNRFQASGLCGRGSTAYDQAFGMFVAAEGLLQRAGMVFGDVVRTWIHLREMERDYPDLNRARRDFFESRGIDPIPASTGIGGGPVSREHDLCLGIYAVRADQPLERVVMTSPTLNEAPTYGADFVRGMSSVESNKIALHVSGTASIDDVGRSVHPRDFGAQADRMLLNIAALLEGQGAGYGDVVSAVTYVKDPVDADVLRDKFREAGFDDFPNVFVHAIVCRPELLCETEVLAVRPR